MGRRDEDDEVPVLDDVDELPDDLGLDEEFDEVDEPDDEDHDAYERVLFDFDDPEYADYIEDLDD